MLIKFMCPFCGGNQFGQNNDILHCTLCNSDFKNISEIIIKNEDYSKTQESNLNQTQTVNIMSNSLNDSDEYTKKAEELKNNILGLKKQEQNLVTNNISAKELYKIAKEKYDLKLFDEIIEPLTKSAEMGNSDAQNLLGDCYYIGRGVKLDYNRAVYWYSKSAGQNNAEAQNNLGDCYFLGDGVEENNQKAFELFLKSANQNNVHAQNNLGDCYYNGNGIEQDYNKAFYWYSKSASNGDDYGQKALGDCYYYGNGVTQNYDKAIEWYSKAGNQGNSFAQLLCGDVYKEKKDYHNAIYWYKQSARQGDKDAIIQLKELGEKY